MASKKVDRDSITLADLLGLNEPDESKASKPKKKKKKKKIVRFYSEEHIQMALHEIDNGISSMRKAAEKYNIPRSTLVFRRSPKFTKIQKGPRPILTKEEEDQLVMWILEGEKYGAPRRSSHIQQWVQELLNEHPRENVPFPDNKPQRGWMKSFMKRHPELDAMKSVSFDDHCETARANVKKVAMEDVSSKPADIINQSIANNELVGQKDVQSLRRAIYRTRVACQEKNSLDPLDISEPLTADALVGDGDCSQVELKLEVIDPAYEEETEHSKNVKELLNPGQETRPIADNDLNILPEITEEKPGFYNNVESAEPDSKRVKVETCDYRVDYPSESSSSFALAGSGRSSPSLMSCESRQIVGNSDDVEYVPQKVAASPAKRGLSSAPAPSGESATRSAERRDRSDIFGEYVAAKLRSLKTDAARNRVECLVANILYEASQGKFDNIDSNLDIAAELQAFLNSTKDLETLKIERGMDSSAVH